MPVSLEKAIQHYARFWRPAADRQAAIARKLQPLVDQGIPAGEKLESIVRSAYLMRETIYGHSSKDPAIIKPVFMRLLDLLFSELTGEQSLQVKPIDELSDLEAMFKTIVSDYALGDAPFPSEPQLDLDSFPDRVLITSMAFINFCQQACKHCGSAEQWDGRHHTLDQLKRVRDKIRFPLASKVVISLEEPFTLPFLLDAVKYLLDEGAAVGVVTSLLGTTPTRREELLKGMQHFHDHYGDRVTVRPSFDLFRRKEINAYLSLFADALNKYPVIASVNYHYDRANRDESFFRLRQLLGLVDRGAVRKNIFLLLEQNESGPETKLWPVGRAAAADPSRALFYLKQKDDLFFPDRDTSPLAQGFMLFPGGSIVPEFCWEAAQIRSLGNILHDPPREIYARFEKFEAKYLARLAQNASSCGALVLTEQEMRSEYGIPPHFVTNFDTLAATFFAQDRQGANSQGDGSFSQHFSHIAEWTTKGLSSWKGIGAKREEVIAFYRPHLLTELKKNHAMEKDFAAQLSWVYVGAVSYEEIRNPG